MTKNHAHLPSAASLPRSHCIVGENVETVATAHAPGHCQARCLLIWAQTEADGLPPPQPRGITVLVTPHGSRVRSCIARTLRVASTFQLQLL